MNYENTIHPFAEQKCPNRLSLPVLKVDADGRVAEVTPNPLLIWSGNILRLALSCPGQEW